MIQIPALVTALKALPQRAVAIVIAATGLFVAGWFVNGWRLDAEIAKLQVLTEQDRVKRAEQFAHAVADARAEEQRRTAAQTEIANAATKDLEQARGDARAADDAAERLRVRVAELLAADRAGKDPAAADPSTPALDPIGMLADVLERADRRAGILATYSDQAHIAGLACERAYDALSGDAER